MRRLLICAAALLAPAVVSATCPPKNLTNVVRIRAFDCNFTASTIKVKLAGAVWDATKAPGSDYWEVILTQRIDALNYPIRIQPGQGLSDCCQSAIEKPVSVDSNDCYVEYTVSCDKPEWGITVASTPQLTFEYERDHPDGFDGWACMKTAPVAGTVTGLGATDQVRLLLRRNNISVLNYPITLPILLQRATIPLTRHDLEVMIDAEAKQAAVNDTQAARAVVAARKKLLPDSITLTKSQ
jgi:hypothetical protein